MPRFDQGLDWRRLAVGLALTGVSAWAARQLLAWLRRNKPDPRGDPPELDDLAVTGGPIIVLLENGKLLSARRRVFPSPAQRLRFTPIGTAPGEGAENVQLTGVSLAPAADVFDLTGIESFPGGFDFLVQVRRAETDAILFHGTDNTLAPNTVWRGDDPGAPPWLLAAQRRLDAEWEEYRRDVPDLERRIALGRFDDVSGGPGKPFLPAGQRRARFGSPDGRRASSTKAPVTTTSGGSSPGGRSSVLMEQAAGAFATPAMARSLRHIQPQPCHPGFSM